MSTGLLSVFGPCDGLLFWPFLFSPSPAGSNYFNFTRTVEKRAVTYCAHVDLLFVSLSRVVSCVVLPVYCASRAGNVFSSPKRQAHLTSTTPTTASFSTHCIASAASAAVTAASAVNWSGRTSGNYRTGQRLECQYDRRCFTNAGDPPWRLTPGENPPPNCNPPEMNPPG